MQSDVSRLVHAAFPGQYHVHEALDYVSYLPLPARKSIITLCRSQTYPSKGTRIRRRLHYELLKRYELRPFGASRKIMTLTLYEIIDPLEIFISSVTLSGLLIMLIQSIHYHDMTSVHQVFQKGVEAELSSAIESYRPAILRWDLICHHNRKVRHLKSLGPQYRASPVINDYIFQTLSESKSKLSHMTLYPDIGKKTVGDQAIVESERMLRNLDIEVQGTLQDAERYYHKTGQFLPGMTEIRWSWKYNVLKPRLYYARGPDVYYASRYIQAIFNTILECFPQVSRFGRRTVTKLRPDTDSRFYIYDYSSFTSTLEEFRNFVTFLADFFRGIKVTVIDTFVGRIMLDIGEMFDEYNDACNTFIPFDIRKTSWDHFIDPDLEELYHTCGMLGVPGNISGCTLLHGLHLLVVGESEECKVVGDDAAALDNSGDKEQTDRLLQNIGRLEPSKIESWLNQEDEVDEEGVLLEDRTWNYVKRPISRIDNQIVTGQMLSWPPMHMVLNLPDKAHTTVVLKDKREGRMRGAKMLLSFVLSLENIFTEVSDAEKIVISDTYNHLRRQLKTPEGCREIPVWRMLPTDPWLVMDMEMWLLKKSTQIFPIGEIYPGGPVDLVKDEEFVGYNCQALSLAVSLGYATKEVRMQRLKVGSNVDRFIQMLRREPLRFSYNIVIDSSVPSWLWALLQEVYVDSEVDEPGEVDMEYFDTYSSEEEGQ